MSGQYPNRRKFWAVKIIGFALLGGGVVLLLGGVVQFLWNWILPSAAHFGTLTYGQSVGLLVLCRLLFGGFGGGWRGRRPPFGGGQRHEHWREKMLNMTDEERAAFKAKWQGGSRQ